MSLGLSRSDVFLHCFSCNRILVSVSSIRIKATRTAVVALPKACGEKCQRWYLLALGAATVSLWLNEEDGLKKASDSTQIGTTEGRWIIRNCRCHRNPAHEGPSGTCRRNPVKSPEFGAHLTIRAFPQTSERRRTRDRLHSPTSRRAATPPLSLLPPWAAPSVTARSYSHQGQGVASACGAARGRPRWSGQKP